MDILLPLSCNVHASLVTKSLCLKVIFVSIKIVSLFSAFHAFINIGALPKGALDSFVRTTLYVHAYKTAYLK